MLGVKSVLLIAVLLSAVFASATVTWSLVVGVLLLWLLVGEGQHTLYLLYKTGPRDFKILTRYLRLQLFLLHGHRMDKSIADFFDENVKHFPRKAAIIHEGDVWNFARASDDACRVAQAVEGEGLRVGETIALLMLNRPQFVTTWLGASKAGVRTALLNTNLRGESLVHCVRVANARALVVGAELLHCVGPVVEALPELRVFVRGASDEHPVLEKNNCIDLDKRLATCAGVWEGPNKMHFSDVLLYIYTSGTTGLPKAAVITNARYSVFAAATHLMLNLSSDEIIYNPLPLYHTAGGMVGMGQTLIFRTTAVTRAKFSASKYWAECAQYRCTVAQYVGELCRYLLTQPPNTKHRVKVMFGNGLRAEIWEDFTSRFNIPCVGEFYGATEGIASAVNWEGKPGACGFVSVLLPMFYPIMLIRLDADGHPVRGPDGLCVRCKPGEVGEIIGMIKKNDAIRDFKGYVGNEKDTNKKIISDVMKKGDKGFLSGDLLEMDELGYLYFKDRTGDTYRWRGENISTLEVEGAVMRASGDKDVVVFGVQVPHCEGRAGMAVIAAPEMGSGEVEALGERMAEALPPYSMPVFLRVVGGIDTTGTFKLRKKELQDEGFRVKCLEAGSDDNDIYFLKKGKYIKFTKELLEDVENGKAGL